MSIHSLDDSNVKKLLFKLSLPAATGMFVMALYNIVDTIFVGRGVGTLGIAGLSIVFPIQIVVMSLGMLFGIGGASVISRLLGQKNKKKADQAYSNVLLSATIGGLFLAVLGLIKGSQILALFGASPEILPFATDYYNIIIFTSPLFVIAMTGNNLLRSVGMAKAAMTSMIIGAVANIILDPIFIFSLNMGIKGAALATVIAQFCSVLYLIYELNLARFPLTLRIKDLKPNLPILWEVVSVGFSSFIRNIAGSIVFALVNTKLLQYGTSSSVAIYGISIRLVRFLIMPLFGIAQGLQPIIGYNFGAGRSDKVREVCKTGFIWSSALAGAGFLIVMLFSKQLIQIFTTDPILIANGGNALKIMMLGLWTVGFQAVSTTIFQSLGKAKESLLLSTSREILFFLPGLMILPDMFQLNGVWMTMPIADTLAFLLSVVMITRLNRKNTNLSDLVLQTEAAIC